MKCETCQGSGLRPSVDDGCDVYRPASCPSCLGTGTTYYRPCYYCRRPRGNDHQDGCTCNTCLRDVCWGINEDCVATRAMAIETCQALMNIGTGVLIAHLASTSTAIRCSAPACKRWKGDGQPPCSKYCFTIRKTPS